MRQPRQTEKQRQIMEFLIKRAATDNDIPMAHLWKEMREKYNRTCYAAIKQSLMNLADMGCVTVSKGTTKRYRIKVTSRGMEWFAPASLI